MIAIARNAHPDTEHAVDLPYRLCSWALDDPENVALWVDAQDDPVAWAVMQLPFWTIDIAIREDLEPELFPRALEWAIRQAVNGRGEAAKRSAWYVHVFSDRRDRIRALEAAGYACQADVGEDSWSQVLLRHPGDLCRDVKSPEGLTIRPLAGETEVTAYVDLHRSAFESKNMTIEWRRRTLTAPHRLPSADLVVEAEDGRLAGFCIGWLMPGDGNVGQIEPLGVSPAFRDQGVGAALLSQCLARLAALGAEEVLVETDSFRDPALELYKSMGFRPIRDILVYRKDFPV